MIETFSWLIFAAIVFSVLHFIYEGVIAPSLRMHFRYRLFAIRDELRNELTSFPQHLHDEAYSELQEGINRAIAAMAQVHVSTIIRGRRWLKNNPQAAKEIENRRKRMNRCADPTFKRLREQFSSMFVWVLLVNSGGLFFWIVPPIVAILSFHRVRRLLVNVVFTPVLNDNKSQDPSLVPRGC